MDVHDLYTTVSDAIQEIQRRSKDQELTRRVDEYFEAYAPLPALADGLPRFVFARALHTPNLELHNVLDTVKHIPLETLFCEFTTDKFVSANAGKRALGEMVFVDGSSTQKNVTKTLRLIDFTKCEGRSISTIRTTRDESLVDLHHGLLHDVLGAESPTPYQPFTEWFPHSYAFDQEFPYLRYLGLFIKDAVLLENFLTTKTENDFTHKRVMPAFTKLHELFGVKPLIVPIESPQIEGGSFWYYYPHEIQQHLSRYGI